MLSDADARRQQHHELGDEVGHILRIGGCQGRTAAHDDRMQSGSRARSAVIIAHAHGMPDGTTPHDGARLLS